MSRLVRLCEHWEDLGLRVMGPHPVATSIQRNPAGKPIQGKPTVEFEMCPGGEFLPEDALDELVNQLAVASDWTVEDVRRSLNAALEALAADQVGEPG